MSQHIAQSAHLHYISKYISLYVNLTTYSTYVPGIRVYFAHAINGTSYYRIIIIIVMFICCI